jgi:GNAT superfamily N-acetyltransferase
VYIRQFFIAASHRRRGLGRACFERLRSEQFPPGARIHFDVLTLNPDGQRFWQSLGFQPYSLAMRLTP